MPAKPLTPEQVEDADRLRNAFKAFQDQRRADGRPSSQSDLAHEMGFEGDYGQSTVSQYLRGTIPLNGDALLRFCRLLGMRPDEISPSITATEFTYSLQWVNPSLAAQLPPMPPPVAALQWPFPKIDASKVAGLSGNQALEIQTAILIAAGHLGIDIAAGADPGDQGVGNIPPQQTAITRRNGDDGTPARRHADPTASADRSHVKRPAVRRQKP